MLWSTAALIFCVVLASALYLSADEAEKRAPFANATAVVLVGVGVVIFFAGVFGE